MKPGKFEKDFDTESPGSAPVDHVSAQEISENPLLKQTIKKAMGIILIGKLLFWTCALILISTPGLLPNTALFESKSQWPRENLTTLERHLAPWDTGHYLAIARGGYTKGSDSCAFYPLWPFLMRSVSDTCHVSPLYSGIILSNLLSLAALLTSFKIMAKLLDHEIATKGLILMLAFPGAIFFSLPYTESLFLFLLTLFFHFLLSARYRAAAIVAYFLPLTKAIGIFCILPLIYKLWTHRELLTKSSFAIVAPFLGYGTYFATMYACTGNPFEGFDAQKHFPTSPSIWRIIDIPGIFESLITVDTFHASTNSFLDRSLFIISMVTLPALFRMSPLLGLYIGTAAWVSATSTLFISYMRHFNVWFPIFAILASSLHGQNKPNIFWVVTFSLSMLQIWLLKRYLSFQWAG